MMVDDKILLTARYAEGDLDETEKADFENRLLTDEILKQHLADYQQIHQSLKMQLADDAETREFKQTLQTLNAQYFKAEPKVISLKPIIKWFSSVAAVLIVGLLIWAPWQNDPYQDFMDKNKLWLVDRGANEVSELDHAAESFNQKDYQNAKLLLGKLAVKEPNNAMVNYFYGLTLVQLSSFDEAQKTLIQIYNGDSAFKYDAAFALALSYFKQNKKEEAKAWTKKIPSTYKNYEQVNELNNEL